MNTLGTPTATPINVGSTYQNGSSNGHAWPMRPMSSRLSQRVQAVPPSGIRKYFDIAATMEDVISLGIGEPDFVSPPPILQAGIASLQRGQTAYTSNSGIYELREAVARNLRERYGAPWYDPEREVLITVGVSEAMYITMQAILDPGDEVIVPQPCFVSYTASVILAGGTVVDVPTYARDNFFVDPKAVEAAITPRTEEFALALQAPEARVVRVDGAVQVEVRRNDATLVRLLGLCRTISQVPPVTAVLGVEPNGTPLLLRLSAPDVAADKADLRGFFTKKSA